MRFSAITLGLGLLAGTQATPVEERGVVVQKFTFHGGPAQYDLYVPVDGRVVATNNAISVSIIDVPTNYDAINLCTFNTPGPKALVSQVSPQGVKQIVVGPPQPVLSVSCRAK